MKVKTCLKCGNKNLKYSKEKKEHWCNKCGLVMEDGVLDFLHLKYKPLLSAPIQEKMKKRYKKFMKNLNKIFGIKERFL